MVARVLEWKGAMVRARGSIYKAVTQSMFLNISERWVVTEDILKVL